MLSNFMQTITTPFRTFRGVNKMVLLATIAALATNIEKGSFTRTHMPSPFQWLLVASIVLTAIYVLKNRKIKDFFDSLPKKIWFAIGGFYLVTLIGWAIAIFSLGIPTMLHTVLDFGTFTMGVVLLVLVAFYTKDDKRYANWCLYASLIPNIYLVRYFLTHGMVGYWGVTNDFSLDKLLDPNILSKTLLVPAIFFICMALFAWKNKKWGMIIVHGALAAAFSMSIFWTVSRGGIVSLLLGAVVTWIVFSLRAFTLKKAVAGGIIVAAILSVGYMINPRGTHEAIALKASNTLTLPPTSEGKVSNVTVEEIRMLPQTELRLLIWYFYPRYILQHPFGVGPNAAQDFNFQDRNGTHIYVGPDSTYLVVALWGGFLGLAIYLYIMWSAFAALWKRWKKAADGTTLALLGILFTLLLVLFFDGNMSLYWLYIVLGLALVKYKDADLQKEALDENNPRT